MEHRWGTRFPSAHLVRIRTRSGLMASGILRNVSVSGALLETVAPLPLSAYIEVQVLPPQTGSSVAEACVVRTQRNAFGIEWCELAPVCVQRLLSSLMHPLPSEAAAGLVRDTTRRA